MRFNFLSLSLSLLFSSVFTCGAHLAARPQPGRSDRRPATPPQTRTPLAPPARGAGSTQRRDVGSDTGRAPAERTAAGGGAESPSRTDPAAARGKRHATGGTRSAQRGESPPATPRAAREGGEQGEGGKRQTAAAALVAAPPAGGEQSPGRPYSAPLPPAPARAPRLRRRYPAAGGQGRGGDPRPREGLERKEPPTQPPLPLTHSHTGAKVQEGAVGKAPPSHREGSRAGSSPSPQQPFLPSPTEPPPPPPPPPRSLPPFLPLLSLRSPAPAPGAHLRSRAAQGRPPPPAAAAAAPWRGDNQHRRLRPCDSQRAPPTRTAQQVNQPSPVTSGRHPPRQPPEGRSEEPAPSNGTCHRPLPSRGRCARRRGRPPFRARQHVAAHLGERCPPPSAGALRASPAPPDRAGRWQ